MAQMRITGTVTDANGELLTGAIVQLRQNGTGKMVRFGKTDARGSFSLDATSDGYLRMCSSLLTRTVETYNGQSCRFRPVLAECH